MVYRKWSALDDLDGAHSPDPLRMVSSESSRFQRCSNTISIDWFSIRRVQFRSSSLPWRSGRAVRGGRLGRGRSPPCLERFSWLAWGIFSTSTIRPHFAATSAFSGKQAATSGPIRIPTTSRGFPSECRDSCIPQPADRVAALRDLRTRSQRDSRDRVGWFQHRHRFEPRVDGRRVLIAQDEARYEIISPQMAALLTAPIILSQGTFFTIDEGQLSLLEALSVFIALEAQGRKRPAISAAGLAIATVKTATLIPFLFLFLRRSDRRVWFFLTIFMVGLLLATGRPTDVPKWISSCLSNIRAAESLGHMDDFSTANRLSVSVMGIDGVLSRLGMTDRSTIHVITASVLAIVGLWLLYIANRRPDIPRGGICSLVTLYSSVFLYHRNYDLPIQILPLIYSASRIGSSRGPARWYYGWVMFAVVAAINQPASLCYRVYDLPPSWSILKAILVPYSTYFMISALVALALATREDFGHRLVQTLDTSRQRSTESLV